MAEDIKKIEEELEDVEIITLEFDDDTELDCEVVMILEVDGKDYVALAPLEEEDEVIFYNYAEDEEFNPIITEIEDDDLYDKVADEFYAMVIEED